MAEEENDVDTSKRAAFDLPLLRLAHAAGHHPLRLPDRAAGLRAALGLGFFLSR